MLLYCDSYTVFKTTTQILMLPNSKHSSSEESVAIAKYNNYLLSIILIEEPMCLYTHKVWMTEITDRRVGGDASYFRARLRSPYRIS